MTTNQHSPSTEIYEPLLEEGFISISYNAKHNWIYSVWHGLQNTESIIAGTEQILHFARLKKVNKILNNSTKLSYGWEELVDWIVKDYAPRLQQAGIEYYAWIYSDDNKTRNSADKVLKTLQSDIIVIVFDNVPTAEKWLRSLK